MHLKISNRLRFGAGLTLPALTLSALALPALAVLAGILGLAISVPNASAQGGRPPKTFLGLYLIQPRETVDFPAKHAPGTIIVKQGERRLYLVLGDGKAIRYPIAVGREGTSWSGTSTISAKREWPDWVPTPAILARQPNLPRHMEGGPANPLGARALYLGATLYRIHGTNEPWMIGEDVSSGCIRLSNDDVVDLYDRARVGATVIVQH